MCVHVSGFSSISTITDPDQITEEWLTSGSRYTEHIRHFKKLFSAMRVRGFVEFGCGFSTKYFIDNCKQVTSVEFVTPGTGPEWLQYCIKLYKKYPRWKPIAFFTGNGLDTSWAPYKYMGKESVYKACSYQPIHRKSYAPIDPSFLDDLHRFMKKTIGKDVDVAFVDAGVCIRGDLVQTLFNKVPIIVAHDIVEKEKRLIDDVYGYGRVQVPSNYVEIHVPSGMGTAVWIQKDAKYQQLIELFQQYAKEEAGKLWP
jgi:hypothetical protein